MMQLFFAFGAAAMLFISIGVGEAWLVLLHLLHFCWEASVLLTQCGFPEQDVRREQ